MKRYTLLYIVGVLCTFMNLSWAYASNPVKEGNVITGHVIEKGSEAGIAYATVLIVETGKGTVTNDEGYFRFQGYSCGRIYPESTDDGLCYSDKEGDRQQGVYG